jgi:hypothetical protein
LQETLDKAAAAVREEDFATAEEGFREVARSGMLWEPTVTRAALQAPLCALLDGRPGDARSGLRFLQTHLRAGRSPTKLRMPLGRRLEDWFELEAMSLRNIAAGSDEEALVKFLVALRNWEQGEREAAEGMRDFANRKLSGGNAWMAKFQKRAPGYLADAKRLARAEPDWRELASNAKSLPEERETLEKLLPALETKGRAPFEVTSWLDWMEWQQQGKNELK